MFTRPPVAERDIVSILSRDGRATTRTVAEALGTSTRRARERLSATLASGAFELRTDMPRWASGYPVCAWYFLRVSAAQMAGGGANLSGLPAVRTVLSVAGPANLLVSVWLRELSDVEGLEAVVEQKLPAVSILDRCLVLGVRKRMGRVFDEDELPMHVVPWSGA
ncbi:Lrp/AsnC family transcriptional regulator [Rhodococcus sp. WS4]|nr:Lrp/AsnC family transcriptional regulator [Rhodococcus sp. WS4]